MRLFVFSNKKYILCSTLFNETRFQFHCIRHVSGLKVSYFFNQNNTIYSEHALEASLYIKIICKNSICYANEISGCILFLSLAYDYFLIRLYLSLTAIIRNDNLFLGFCIFDKSKVFVSFSLELNFPLYYK